MSNVTFNFSAARVALARCFVPLVRKLRRRPIEKLAEIWVVDEWGMWMMKKSEEYFLLPFRRFIFAKAKVTWSSLLWSFRIADWLSKQSERDQEKARRKQERLERLKAAPKHVFEDSTAYTSQIQENMDSIDDALQKGCYATGLWCWIALSVSKLFFREVQ